MTTDDVSVLTRFKANTATHEMEVVLDNGMHRHLRFRRPGTYCYGFDVVTYPGLLVISGDMGAAVFSRLDDMFEFFRSKPKHHDEAGGLYINQGYWAEKCVANDGDAKQFGADLHAKVVKGHFDDYMAEQDLAEIENGPALAEALWDEIDQSVLAADNTRDAVEMADAFEPDKFSDHHAAFGDFRFIDYWDSASALEGYTFHFVWRLYAIAHAVKAYDELRAEVPA